MISLMLPITPVAWGRVKRGRLGNAYVPAKTRNFKSTLALLIRSKFRDKPFEGPLKLTVTFVLARPKTIKRAYPAVRPDLDNYVKAVKDGANGILFLDDSQVCGLIAWKKYGETSYIVLTLEELS